MMTDDNRSGTDENRSGTDENRSGSTDTASERHWLTNDGIAWLLTLSMVGVVTAASLGIVDLSTVPQEILVAYVVAFGVAIVWAFGRDALEAWRGGGES